MNEKEGAPAAEEAVRGGGGSCAARLGEVEIESGEGKGSGKGMAEQIAGTRWVLGNILALAEEDESGGKYTHLAEVYGSGRKRLMGRLKAEAGGRT